MTSVEQNFSLYHQNLSFVNESSPTENNKEKMYFSDYPDSLLIFGAACTIILAIFGTAGNFISIVALVMCKHIRNATTAFIVNLCLSDLLFCCFCMPLSAQLFLTGKWFSSNVVCKAFAFVKFLNPMVSMFTVLAITINRYILIFHPNFYLLLYMKSHTFAMILIIWFFPVTLLSLPLSGMWGEMGHHPVSKSCTIFKVNGTSPKLFIYIIGLVVPSLLFIMCYTAIFTMVRKMENRRKQHKNQPNAKWTGTKRCDLPEIFLEVKLGPLSVKRIDKKTLRLIRMILVIFIVFAICYFPMFYLKVFRKGREIPLFNVFSYICFFLSTVVNPVIYIAMSREYRKAYRSLFCKS